MFGEEGIREHYTLTVAAAALATLRSDPVPRGFTYVLNIISYEGDNATAGGFTRARVYIDGHGPKLYVDEFIVPVANTLYSVLTPLFLMEGERIALEWDQAQVATVLQLTLCGVRYPVQTP